MDLLNPYAAADRSWLKGALHVHTTNSDGKDSPHEVIRDYERRGFDFIALTDHNAAPAPADLQVDTRMVVIPGVEYRGAGADAEIGIIGIRQVPPRAAGIPEYHQAALASGGFCIYNHPTWHIHHWPIWWMLKLPALPALEIYNAVVDWLPGAAECTDQWDRLLTAGGRIWGVASDDAHNASQRHRGWVMVNAEPTEASILAALQAGCFYASSGVLLREIRLEGCKLRIESDQGQEIRFFADRGAMRHRAAGASAEYEIREDDIYVRAEVYGHGASKAWTNPVFVNTERSRQLSKEFRLWYLKQQKALGEI